MKKLLIIFTFLFSILFAETINFKVAQWNFVGFQSNISDVSQDTLLSDATNIEILWSYTNDNSGKRWNAYSPDSTITTELNKFQYNLVSRIENYQGIWIYPNKDFSYTQTSSSLNTPEIPGDEYYAGWNLLSSPTGTAIDVTILSNASRVFVYRDGLWHGYFNDGTTIDGVTPLSTIGATEAYWVYYGSNSSTTSTNISSIPEVPTSILSGKVDTQTFISRVLSKVTTSDENPNTDRLWITPESVASSISIPPAVPGSGSVAVKPPEITKEVEIESDGSYTIPDLPSGAYSLVYANNRDSIQQGVKIDKVIVPPGQNVTQDIRRSEYSSYGSIQLKVQSLMGGNNISGVRVRINQLNLIDISDNNGLVEFSKVPQGNYSITVGKDGYVSTTKSFYIGANTQSSAQVIKLNSQKGSLSGIVTAEGLDNYSNILVYAKSIDGSTYSTLTNSLGYYTFEGLPLGNGYSVMASANGFQVAKVENLEIRNGRTTTAGSIILVPYPVDKLDNVVKVGSITGYARYLDVNDSLEHAGIVVSIEGTDYDAVTSRDGSYVLNNIPEGNYTLNFTDSNHKTKTSDTIEVISAAEHFLDEVQLLPKTGNVIGIVHDEAGSPVENVFIVVNTLSQTLTTYTDSNGNFTLNGVLAGEYEIQAAKDGYGAGSVYTMITENQTKDTASTPIVVTRKLLTGTINLQNTTDHSGAIVSLVGSDVPLATTDSSGDFILYGVSAGNYQLQISKAGYLTENITLAISSENGYEIPYIITTNQSIGTLKGIVQLDDKSLPSGIIVDIVGTGKTSTTDALGLWLLNTNSKEYTDQKIRFTLAGYKTYEITADFNVTDGEITNLNTPVVLELIDVIPPKVVSTTPIVNTKYITADTNITITFDDDMNEGTLSKNNITLKDEKDNIIPINLSYSNKVLNIEPINNLELYETQYYLSLSTDIKDDENNTLETNYQLTFTTDATIKTIKGYVQFSGAFLSETSITIQELNDEFLSTGTSYSTTVSDNNGYFAIGATLKSKYIEVTATGNFFNPVSNLNTTTPITLKAIVDISKSDEIYINPLTTISKDRLKALVVQNANFETANIETVENIKDIFGIDSFSKSFENISIFDDNIDSAKLLGSSLALLGVQNNTDVQAFMSAISLDIKDDGILNNVSLIDKLKNNQLVLSYEESEYKYNIVQHQNDYDDSIWETYDSDILQSQGFDKLVSISNNYFSSYATLFYQYIDSDGDGVLNIDDIFIHPIGTQEIEILQDQPLQYKVEAYDGNQSSLEYIITDVNDTIVKASIDSETGWLTIYPYEVGDTNLTVQIIGDGISDSTKFNIKVLQEEFSVYDYIGGSSSSFNKTDAFYSQNFNSIFGLTQILSNTYASYYSGDEFGGGVKTQVFEEDVENNITTRYSINEVYFNPYTDVFTSPTQVIVSPNENYAILKDGKGFGLIDISQAPKQKRMFSYPDGQVIPISTSNYGSELNIKVSDDWNTVYAESLNKIYIIDISDKTMPNVVGSYELSSSDEWSNPYIEYWKVSNDGSKIIFSSGNGTYGVGVLDISNPSNITSIGFFDTTRYISGLSIDETNNIIKFTSDSVQYYLQYSDTTLSELSSYSETNVNNFIAVESSEMWDYYTPSTTLPNSTNKYYTDSDGLHITDSSGSILGTYKSGYPRNAVASENNESLIYHATLYGLRFVNISDVSTPVDASDEYWYEDEQSDYFASCSTMFIVSHPEITTNSYSGDSQVEFIEDRSKILKYSCDESSTTYYDDWYGIDNPKLLKNGNHFYYKTSGSETKQISAEEEFGEGAYYTITIEGSVFYQITLENSNTISYKKSKQLDKEYNYMRTYNNLLLAYNNEYVQYQANKEVLLKYSFSTDVNETIDLRESEVYDEGSEYEWTTYIDNGTLRDIIITEDNQTALLVYNKYQNPIYTSNVKAIDLSSDTMSKIGDYELEEVNASMSGFKYKEEDQTAYITYSRDSINYLDIYDFSNYLNITRQYSYENLTTFSPYKIGYKGNFVYLNSGSTTDIIDFSDIDHVHNIGGMETSRTYIGNSKYSTPILIHEGRFIE